MLQKQENIPQPNPMKNHIPIYVISTKRTPERRLYIQRQLDALGLEYKIIDTIDKHDLVSKTYRSYIANFIGIDKSAIENLASFIFKGMRIQSLMPLNKKIQSYLGMMATSLSHIEIYNLMLKNNVNEACILEDDVTLLPSFYQTLEAAPKLSWDILLLTSTPPLYVRDWLQNKGLYKFIGIKSKNIGILVKQRIENNSNIEFFLKEYGFNEHQYPNQSKVIAKTLQKFNDMSNALTKEHFLVIANDRFMLFDHFIKRYITTLLGGLTDRAKLKSIDNYHCIAPPRAWPRSAMAYCVKKSAAEKWKQVVLNSSKLRGIDMFYGQLYLEGVQVRLVTPPCATGTFNYMIYSTSYNILPEDQYQILPSQLIQLSKD